MRKFDAFECLTETAGLTPTESLSSGEDCTGNETGLEVVFLSETGLGVGFLSDLSERLAVLS